jgi:hypothetical protein
MKMVGNLQKLSVTIGEVGKKVSGVIEILKQRSLL